MFALPSRTATAATVAFLLLGCDSALAQVWNARQMLAQLSTPRVQLLTKETGSVPVETIERAWVARMVSVVDRMAGSYGMTPPELILVRTPGPNAFVTLHEQRVVMAFNVDMLKMVGDDDDLTAAVVGHEFAHVQARHLTDGQTRQGIVSLIGILAGLAVDVHQAKRGVDTQGLGMQVGNLGSGLVNAKFSRDQEREADNIGMHRMTQAGFDPNATVRLWRLMTSQGAVGDGLFLASHPSPAERLQTLQATASTLSTATVVATAPATAPTNLPYRFAKPAEPYPTSRYPTVALTAEEQAAAQPSAYRLAMEAHRAQQFTQAFEQLNEAALSGDERALGMLGDYYATGRGGSPRDDAKALEYFTASADKGFAPSIYMLGEFAETGRGGPTDKAKAVSLFRLADSRGNGRASARLGLMYLTGNGVDRDINVARYMAQRSVNAGDLVGKSLLGAMMRDGIGGPVEGSRGFELMLEGAKSKVGYSLYQLGLTYEKGVGTHSDKDKAIAAYKEAQTLGAKAAGERLKALGASD